MDSRIINACAYLWRSATTGATIILLLAASNPAQSERLQLRPSKNYWGYWGGGPRHPKVHLLPLSGNRRLASVGDTLYMLNRHNRIVWKWTSNGPTFTDLPIIDSTGTIYVIGYDLLWAAIDSSDGRKKWTVGANGRATYSQIKLYQGNMYLVVTNMGGYRDSLNQRNIEDHLSLAKGNALLWETSIPPDSRIEVSGTKVFVVSNRKKHIVRRLIKIPRQFNQPIRRISPLAAHE